MLKTHEDIMKELIDSFEKLLNEIEVSQKQLEMSGRTSVQARFFRTRKVITEWGNTGGKRGLW
jgi:hypothetical protein